MVRLVKLVVATLVTVLVAGPLAAPASATDVWQPVQEPWQPYTEGGLLLPAERYCGDFDLESTPVRQELRSRVLSRWQSGEPREVEYAGPLVVEAVNTTSGESVRLNLSGHAWVVLRPDGSLSRYETSGPVGMGFPTGSIGLAPGFYRFTGRHVVEFPASGPRQMVLDQGTETDVCDLVA